MQSREIPKSKEQLPVIGMGTWRTFDIGSDRARKPLIDVVRRFSEFGGRLIDTSPMYGKAEEVVGEMRSHVKEPFIATKVWTRGREAGIEQMKRSKTLMRATQIDLIQIHNLVDWQTHMVTLRNWKANGLIRYIGVTHYQTGAFAQLAEIMNSEEIDFVQLPMSAELPDAEQRLLPLAQAKGVAVIVNRPFEEGGLLRRVRSKPLPQWAGEFDSRSWSELFLRYIVSHPAVTCVIPATSSVQHLEENMRAGEGRMLSMNERQRLRKLLSGS
jgi:diketogulonate reductase-like aldo/keto reductase